MLSLAKTRENIGGIFILIFRKKAVSKIYEIIFWNLLYFIKKKIS